MTLSKWLQISALALSVAGAAQADVQLPAIFGDNMVLQQGAELPVWGKADRGERVTVLLNGHEVSTDADAAGVWRVTLGAQQISTTPTTLTIRGRNEIVLHNVLIGEVWLGAGQSNMEFSVLRARNGEAEVAAANHPTLRLFVVKKNLALEPALDVTGQWVECTPETVKGFSAVLYYFGRDLQEQVHAPVGLIEAAWSGTRIQAWMPLPTLQSDPRLSAQVTSEAKNLDDPAWLRAENERKLAAWTRDSAQAKADGKPEPRKPAPVERINSNRCGALFGGMIAPLAPYALRGVAWYQAENNAGGPELYAKMFPRMIESWRAKWLQPQMPFVFVQLPNWISVKPGEETSDTNWVRTREAQASALKLPHTAMAVTIDVGQPENIHPLNKQTVGHRLMLAALEVAYDRTDVATAGPAFESMSVEGTTVRVRFNHAGGGLTTSDIRPVAGFTVAGRDRVFHIVTGRIDGSSVVLDCADIPNVQSVRYAWGDDPQANLYNREGLPAVPFRTDSWPRQAHPVK